MFNSRIFISPIACGPCHIVLASQFGSVCGQVMRSLPGIDSFDHLFIALSIDIFKGNHVLTQVNSDGVCYLVPPLAVLAVKTGFGKCLGKRCLKKRCGDSFTLPASVSYSVVNEVPKCPRNSIPPAVSLSNMSLGKVTLSPIEQGTRPTFRYHIFSSCA